MADKGASFDEIAVKSDEGDIMGIFKLLTEKEKEASRESFNLGSLEDCLIDDHTDVDPNVSMSRSDFDHLREVCTKGTVAEVANEVVGWREKGKKKEMHGGQTKLRMQ